MAAFVEFRDVSFTYPSLARRLLEGLDLHIGAGWTGVVGPNGAGKSTLLRLATDLLAPSGGDIVLPGPAVYCPQRTDEPPPGLAEMLAAHDALSYQLRGRLGLADDWLDRWATLSHGERKRAQIAAALYARPDVLALDEPTNHVDAEARELLVAELQRFGGVGLLVSHDRAFLERLVSAYWRIEPSSEGSSRLVLESGA